jgi:hypothetical protein
LQQNRFEAPEFEPDTLSAATTTLRITFSHLQSLMSNCQLSVSSVHTLHNAPALSERFITGAKPEINFLYFPSIPQPPLHRPSHAVSTSVHLYGDVLLSKVFSILFEKKKTLPTYGPMMRLSRETATSFTLGASGCQCKSGQTHSIPSPFVARFLDLA